MATARDLIKGSLRLLGVLSTGDTPQASDANDALLALNQMVESWSTENLLIPSVVREEFSFVAGQGAYTMGSGGDFDTTRPVDFIKVLYQDNNASPKYEIELKRKTAEEWACLDFKDVQSDIPYCYYTEGTNPLETINFYYVPSGTKKVVIYSHKPIGSFTLDTEITLPPGYFRALRYNLALELSPEYGDDPQSAIVIIATESLANIKRQNITPTYSACDSALVNSKRSNFDYRTGE